MHLLINHYSFFPTFEKGNLEMHLHSIYNTMCFSICDIANILTFYVHLVGNDTTCYQNALMLPGSAVRHCNLS